MLLSRILTECQIRLRAVRTIYTTDLMPSHLLMLRIRSLQLCLEQLNIRKAELNSHLIKDKSDEAEQNIKINDISARLETAQKNALDIAERIAAQQ